MTTTTATHDHINLAREMASSALGYVQAGQSDPALYRMLYDLCHVLEGDTAEIERQTAQRDAERDGRAQLAARVQHWGDTRHDDDQLGVEFDEPIF